MVESRIKQTTESFNPGEDLEPLPCPSPAPPPKSWMGQRIDTVDS